VLGERERELRTALRLGYFTVAWNLVEGLVAITAALLAGSQALLGFGLDSGIESLSAGVLIWRLQIERRNPHRAVEVERRALRLIGGTFFVVASFVAVDAVLSLVQRRKPDTSLLGIAVTVASLVVMPYLAMRKRRVGQSLGSDAVVADSAQSRACAYLSIVVLVGLVANALFGWWWADPTAALFVVAFLVREGHEALSAEHLDDCC
jgi:divalent metal cation (Fe/Co/Zn/Cd) transporter